MSSTAIVGYLALFTLLGFLFLLVNLLVGRLVRPQAPNFEKLEIYECGEPTIGSSFVQFDLRFYVVALLFIIFDVEVAFFFPWAVVFGKATHLMDPQVALVESAPTTGGETAPRLTAPARNTLESLGVALPGVPDLDASIEANAERTRAAARTLAGTSICDILVFFAVLMVGFAYVWRRGDLDWVRAVGHEPAAAPPGSPVLLEEPDAALVS
ncbi:MAG TPA: NADH-quinone oxidoreductase subunit A [Pirellulales bacterium]|jgi:NADH-quinone oxidoreductase subunit A|nr:NADH-quinone oxidoreductase subunit A [Pirellulales bacterium]